MTFSKCDFFRKLRILSDLRKKSLMEKFIFCAVGISRSSYSDFDFVFQSTWSPTKKVKQINLNKISKPILT